MCLHLVLIQILELKKVVKQLINFYPIQLNLPLDLKNILDKRALKHKQNIEEVILVLIKTGLTEAELIQEQANLFIDRVLEARQRRKAKTNLKKQAHKTKKMIINK